VDDGKPAGGIGHGAVDVTDGEAVGIGYVFADIDQLPQQAGDAPHTTPPD
jgi:hypothetical protein